MLSVQIEERKKFMNALLIQNTFDNLLLMQGNITTYNTYEIDGHIDPKFFGEDYEESPLFGFEYTPWSHFKEIALNLIKGKHTPLFFKFVLYAQASLREEILSQASNEARQNVKDLVLTIRFGESGLSVTSGISTTSFVMDKTADEQWDLWVKSFLSQNSLS